MLINERRKTDRRPKIPRTGKNLGLGAALAALAIVFFAYQTQSSGTEEVDTSSIEWQASTTLSCDSVDSLSGELAVGKDLVCLRVDVGDGKERLIVMASDITGLVLVLDGDDARIAISPIIPSMEGLGEASIGLLENSTIAVRFADGSVKLIPLLQN